MTTEWITPVTFDKERLYDDLAAAVESLDDGPWTEITVPGDAQLAAMAVELGSVREQ